jgi:hypothetical protein
MLHGDLAEGDDRGQNRASGFLANIVSEKLLETKPWQRLAIALGI